MQTQKEKEKSFASDVALGAKNLIDRIFTAIGGESKEEKAQLKERLTAFLRGAGIAVFSAAAAGTVSVFSTLPFGLAYLSAAGKAVPYTYVGCMAGAFLSGEQTLLHLIAYTLIFILRYFICRLLSFPEEEELIGIKRPVRRRGQRVPTRLEIPVRFIESRKYFGEKIYLRMSVGCAAAFCIGIWRIISGGFLYYDLFGAIFLIAVTPFLIFLYSGLFSKRTEATPYFEAGVAALLFTAVCTLRGAEIAAMRLDIIFPFAVTLLVSKIGGGLRAALIGLLMGIAVDPISAPMFGIVGLLSSLLWKYSYAFSLSVSIVSALIFGIYAEGTTALFRLLPEFATGGAITVPIVKSRILSRLKIFEWGVAEPEAPPPLEEIICDSNDRFSELSDTLSSVSETFRAISETRSKPTPEELRSMCSGICEKYCVRCSMKPLCWEKDTDTTLDMLKKIATVLYTRGRAKDSDLPDYMHHRCFRLNNIIEESNRGAAELISRCKASNNARIFSLDVGAMAGLIDSAIKEKEEENGYSPELSDKLRRALDHSELSAERIGVYGKRRHYVVASGISLARTKISSSVLHSISQNTLGEPLTEPDYSVDGSNVSLTMKSRKTITTESASAERKKGGSDMSGDSHTIFETRDDYSYSVISDGMGSGKSAATLSRLSIMILSKMLTAKNSVTASLGMLSAFLRGEKEEGSATADVCEIDLLRSSATFYKCGAAPSFVRRGGKLFKIESKTFPLGILDSPDTEKVSLDLNVGDVIIMLSDGVVQSFDDSSLLLSLLEDGWDDDLGVMSEKIASVFEEMRQACDDITVILTRIKEADAE
ncbi:MAG: SpoIIE family protein phosphatase [Clostridia bacterium]|nr:SpoIIE family protein phosphatase [Clostridia bacterium]